MPSPFPGMDPYLEERGLWSDLHSTLISYIREALQPQVRPKYVARIGERIEIAALGRSYVPDVMIVQPPREPTIGSKSVSPLVADNPLTIELLDEEQRVPYIEIIYRDTGDVVTSIEVLSPVNKVGEGREQYLEKQDNLLDSEVNLVEIDLLKYGRTPTLARKVEIREPSDWRYLVCISRAHRRRAVELYAVSLKERLPRCRIPLQQSDPDAVLDLPAVFTRCYDVGGYDLLIDYAKAPSTSLSKGEQTWMEALLQEKGLRPPES